MTVKMKILVIEDDPLNRKLFNDVLNLSGFETILSVDGLDAMALAEQHMPDAIIMDMQLPYKSGLDITRTLKETPHLANIPVIAVTGFTASAHRKTCMDSGCDGYLIKPLQIWDLTEIVCRLIGIPVPQLRPIAFNALPVCP